MNINIVTASQARQIAKTGSFTITENEQTVQIINKIIHSAIHKQDHVYYRTHKFLENRTINELNNLGYDVTWLQEGKDYIFIIEW